MGILSQKKLTRALLYNRHRLSHRQINDWIGEGKHNESPEQRIAQLAKVASFVEITDWFREHKISFLSFKGPLLSQKIYKDPTYRYYNDFDFLIDRSNIDLALKVLHDKGFHNVHFRFPEKESKKQLWLDHTNEIMLFHPEKELTIEIHWNLFAADPVLKQNLKNLVDTNTTSINFSGREYTVFSHEFDLIYLIIHGGGHFWGRLKWLVDIKELIERFPLDEKKFLNISTELRAGRLVALCNSLLKIYFPDSKLLPCNDHVSQSMIDKALYTIQAKEMFEMGNTKEYIRYYWNHVKLVPGLRYKINILKQILFAPDLAEKKWMPCSAFLNYLMGPLWKLSRGIRN